MRAIIRSKSCLLIRLRHLCDGLIRNITRLKFNYAMAAITERNRNLASRKVHFTASIRRRDRNLLGFRDGLISIPL